MNEDQFRDFVNNFTWTYAITYAKICPHEYIVKNRIDKGYWDNFTAVVRYIREKGFTAIYKSRSGQYHILDDYYYWAMSDPVEETTVLNRAKLSEYKLIVKSWAWNGEL